MKKKTTQQKNDRTLPILLGAFAVLLVIMTVALCIPRKPIVGEFVPPEFDPAAVAGVPEAEESLGYTTLYKEGMAYSVSICGVPAADGKALTVYFTNDEGNEKYLKLRVMDTGGNILGETGLLKPGEYVKSVSLSKELAAGTSLKLKIMGYEPEDYTSAGAVSLNVTVGG